MEKLFKILEDKVEKYITAFEEKPLTTIVKTLVVLWLFKQAKNMLK